MAEVMKKAIFQNDCRRTLHISIAAVQGIDFLLTWNFKHINNANMRDKMEQLQLPFDKKYEFAKEMVGI
jgi:hypothetical protein